MAGGAQKRAAEGPAVDGVAARRPRPSGGAAAGPGSAAALLPEGWAEAFDPGHRRAYFFNVGTGERAWERPTGGGGGATPGTLPLGWVEGFDPQHGRNYYFCVASGQTQWERPGVEGSAGPAGPAGPPGFTSDPGFSGPRAGCFFDTGTQGTGYYRDAGPQVGAVGASDRPCPQLQRGGGVPGTEVLWGRPSSVRGRGLGRAQRQGRGAGGPLRPGMQIAKADGSAYVLPKDPFRKTEGYTQATTPEFCEQTARLAAAQRARGRGRGRGRGKGPAQGGAGQGGIGRAQPPAISAPGKDGYDPMDPSAYSTAPQGGWGVGLGQDTV